MTKKRAANRAPQHSVNDGSSFPACQHTTTSESRAVWTEILAVLAVIFFPSLWSGILIRVLPSMPPLPYWLLVADHAFLLACECIVVLYIMHRSGVPWLRFGVTFPKLSDLALGCMIALLSFVVVMAWKLLTAVLVSIGFGKADIEGPEPHSTLDHVLMVFQFSAVGIAEELAYRAYLVTRFEYILRSQSKAVLVSSLLFALCHSNTSLSGMSDAMLLGVLYGYTFLWMRRVWPLVIGHMLWDVSVTWHWPA